ncbi:protein phosphatase 1 regulatory subunit 12B isoform X2 [Trichogramma pretiosum]|uniref:protein phosphatase 1 regulatory subunit 12B isoform X2 n=1 Tax=Trichogramma pretiosum TaxID=7493 RepID=UPI0006C9B0BC|nr:protein phosphatase 1 regulatory subunit 12B isoform X2 [Trichogramma pretiosum]
MNRAMALENRSSSAQFKRAEQLKRWEQSETNKQSSQPRTHNLKIKFPKECIFLAACTAGDKEEILSLIKTGADINTGNIDGLTALHQACIDDDLDMVEFLLNQGADVNRQDNEGWTPLHATASCGFLSVARFLIDNGAYVAAVNNEGDLPEDIAQDAEMKEFLHEQVESQGLNVDREKKKEKMRIIADAQAWLSGEPDKSKVDLDNFCTSLHVSAAKNYYEVVSLLLKCDCININRVDEEGWTPIHAAAHWGSTETCEILMKNFCDTDIRDLKNQTAIDVADSSIVDYLKELKEKYDALRKDRPEVNNKLLSPKKRASVNKEDSVTPKEDIEVHDEETPSKLKKVELEIQSDKEESSIENSDVEKKNRANREETVALSPQSMQDSNEVSSQPPVLPPKQQDENNKERVASWRRSGSLKSRGFENDENEKSILKTPNSAKVTEEPEVVLRRTQSFEPENRDKQLNLDLVASNNTNQGANLSLPATPLTGSNLTSSSATSPAPTNVTRRSFVPPVRDEESETQRKAHAKRVRETRRSTQGVTLDEIKSAEQLVKKKQQQSNDVDTTVSGTSSNGSTSTTTVCTANANTIPQSTAITTATTTVNNNGNNGEIASTATTTTASITATITTASPTTTSASKLPITATSEVETNLPERRPSWRLKVDGGSKFQLEDANNRSSLTSVTSADTTVAYIRRPMSTNATTTGTGTSGQRPTSAPVSVTSTSNAETTVTLPLRRPFNKPPEDKEQDKENDSRNAQATQAVIQRRRRPKRRSTGVVHVDMDEIDPEKQDLASGEADDSIKLNHNESGHDRSGRSSRFGSVSSLSSDGGVTSSRASKSNQQQATENGELDYKKLWEESQAENERLREKLRKSDEQLKESQSLLEKTQQSQSKAALSETEKRERRAMERKLSEMEEELKILETLKCENQRLKDENGALIRVISKLSK